MRTSHLMPLFVLGAKRSLVRLDVVIWNLCVVLVSSCSAAPVESTALPGEATVVLQPDGTTGQDVWITSVFSYNDNFGVNDESLQVGGWGDLYYSLLRFDITSLPPVASSAKLVLQPFSRGDASRPVTMMLYRATAPWTEESGWFDQPSAEVEQQLPAPVAGSPFTIDITSLYNRWRSGAMPNFGLELRPTSNDNRFNVFRSSDYVLDPSLRPKLVVVYSKK